MNAVGPGILEQLLAEVRALRAELAMVKTAKPSAEVTIAAYAEARQLSPSTVRAAIKAGKLPAKYYGRAVRVPADAEIGAERAVPESPVAYAERLMRSVGGQP